MNTLGLFARFPEKGRTKTRLAASIGDAAAVELYECFLHDLTARYCELCDHFEIAVTPDSSTSRKWFESLLKKNSRGAFSELSFQGPGDLGARMHLFFEQQRREGRAASVVVGSDSPDLPDELITGAWDCLKSDKVDLVLSPAADGGFVLIGMSVEPRHLFDGIRWSSPFTMTDTLVAARRAGLRCEILESWYDIDTVENLGTFKALQEQPGRTNAAACPRSLSCLARLMPEFGTIRVR